MSSFDYIYNDKKVIKSQFTLFVNCYNKRKNGLPIKRRKKIEKLISKLKGELELL